MEKNIKVIARYRYKQGYFVEVSHEDSVIAGRDYWLCRENSPRKMFMFSSSYSNDQAEERMIKSYISDSVRKYELPAVSVSLA